MTLRETQSHFAALVPRLIDQAIALGFEVTLGEAYRSPEEAARLARLGRGITIGRGITNSLHTSRLAIDLHLFKDGVYQTSSEAHRPLGEWWEAQGGAWGGRFTRPDGNHYSWPWEGRA